MTTAVVETLNFEHRLIELPSGTLEVTVHAAPLPQFGIDKLCDFAARNNPKRGFLVVSKVLGRHIPTKPETMNDLHYAMAKQINNVEPLPGPVLFLAMAETATCLGHAVHDAYRDISARQDTLCLHSTRQVIAEEAQVAGIIAEFTEPHSHAASHIVYEPVTPTLRNMLAKARTLVLVDDESSTGTTFLNAANALAKVMPCLENVTTCVITDWSEGDQWRLQMAWEGTSHAILRGRLKWTPRTGFVSSDAPVTNTGALGALWNTNDYGRRGTPIVHHLTPFAKNYDQLGIKMAVLFSAERYLIIGTGEFTYPAFLMALAIARQGNEVELQATTRSPVHVGGAIDCTMTFHDNYGSNVPNFLYNATPETGRKVIICCETGVDTIDPELVKALDADVLSFGSVVSRKQL